MTIKWYVSATNEVPTGMNASFNPSLFGLNAVGTYTAKSIGTK